MAQASQANTVEIGPPSLSRKGRVMTCKFCHETGHNKRGCPKAKSGALGSGSEAGNGGGNDNISQVTCDDGRESNLGGRTVEVTTQPTIVSDGPRQRADPEKTKTFGSRATQLPIVIDGSRQAREGNKDTVTQPSEASVFAHGSSQGGKQNRAHATQSTETMIPQGRTETVIPQVRSDANPNVQRKKIKVDKASSPPQRLRKSVRNMLNMWKRKCKETDGMVIVID